MSYETLEVSVAEGVATILLARPDKLNAFDDQMKIELLAALKQVEKDEAVRAVVLSGSGRAFCSGQDLNLDRPGDLEVGELLRTLYHPIFTKLRTMAKPVIAAVNGVAAGMGMSLALACDYRLMAEGSYMSMAFIRIGLIPDCGGTFFLPRLVGPGRAFELAALGDKCDSAKCLDWGLVNEVHAPESLMEAAIARARGLAAGPTAAYGLLKRALNHSLGMPLEDQLEVESHLQQVAARTADFQEGIRAFAEKRKPVFTGR